MTRAEFLKLCLYVLSRGPNLTVSPAFPAPVQAPFQDVPVTAWYSGYVAFAKQCGITEAAQGLFDPDAHVTRGEAVGFIMRTLELNGGARAKDPLQAFPDSSDSDVINARSADIAKGREDGLFHPNLSLNRAEAVAMIARALPNLENAPPVSFGMTAYTPDNPLIPEVALTGVCPRVGIRFNRPNDSAHLIRVRLDLGPTESGTYYALRRTENSIKVWPSKDKSSPPYLGENDSYAFPSISSSLTTNVYVENVSPFESVLYLELRRQSDHVVLASKRLGFHYFDHAVIVLEGEEFNDDTLPSPTSSIGNVGRILYERGYDVYMYNEGHVDGSGSGAVFDDVFDAMTQRFVRRLAIIGFSHGGGAVYDLVSKLVHDNRLDELFTLEFTAYVDAIKRGTPDPDLGHDAVTQPPEKSKFHVNIYQHKGCFLSCFLKGTSIPDSDVELDVTDDTEWGKDLVHKNSIAEDYHVWNLIVARLVEHLEP